MSSDQDELPIQWGDILRRMISALVPGRGRIATCVIITILFFAALVLMWKSVEFSQLKRDCYILTTDKIHLKQWSKGKIIDHQPSWIPRDLTPEMVEFIANQLQQSPNEPFNILNPKFVEESRKAIQQHPWVRRVVSVTKKSPAELEVVVEFRRPVLFVEVLSPEKDTATYYPVDEDAKILPLSDFPQVTLDMYPHLTEYPYPPMGTTPGSCWERQTVEDAVRIVRDFGDYWNQMELDSLHAYIVKDDETLRSEVQYDLRTKKGSIIHWGTCSREDSPHRKRYSNQEKIQSLILHLNREGKLEQPGLLKDLYLCPKKEDAF